MTITDRNVGYDGLKLERANSFLVSFCELFGRTFCALFGIGATSWPDLQNKGVTNRVKPSVCVPELLGRGVLPPAFGNVHCYVDLHIHQDAQSVGIPLAAGILECSADVPTGTRQAEILQHPLRDRFSPFIQPFLQRYPLILRLHYEFFGLLLAESMLLPQNVLSQLFAIDDVSHLERRPGNRLIENRF